MKPVLIYGLLDKADGLIKYAGSTVVPEQRKAQYLTGQGIARGYSNKVKRWIDRIGIGNVGFQELEWTTEEDRDDKENEWIALIERSVSMNTQRVAVVRARQMQL